MNSFTNTPIQTARRVFIVLFLTSLFLPAPFAQSIWTGAAGNSNWNNPANWTGGVPAAGKTVTIYTCSTCPVITTTDNQASFVQVYAGGKLTIGTSGSLMISNPGGPGLKTHATSQVNVNQGSSLTVQNFWGEGIAIGGTFQNGGTISINGGHTGIAVSAGASFTNNVNGTTTITGYSLNYAITSSGTVLNNGSLTLDDANNDGINQPIGMFTNGQNGTLNITKTGVNAIFTKGTFNNNGTLNIDNGLNGIYLLNGTFNNNATGNLSIGGNIFLNDGIYVDAGTFKNAGELSIQKALSKGMEISNGSTFNNFNKINLNVPAWAGIFNVGGSNFTNKPCSQIESNSAIVNYAIFTNSGVIKAPNGGGTAVNTNNGSLLGNFTVNSGNAPITESGAIVWVGCSGTNWADVKNWYPSELPVPPQYSKAIVQNVSQASGNTPVVSSTITSPPLFLQFNAALQIATGGSLHISDGYLGSGYLEVRQGATFTLHTGSTFNSTSVSILSGNVQNNGSFNIPAPFHSVGNFGMNGGTFVNDGQFNASVGQYGAGLLAGVNNGAVFSNSGAVSIGGVGGFSVSQSSLMNQQNGSIVLGSGAGQGSFKCINGSTVQNLGTLVSGDIKTLHSSFTNSGNLQLGNKTPALYGEAAVYSNAGNITLNEGHVLLYEGSFDNSGNIQITNPNENGLVNYSHFTNNGSLTIQFSAPSPRHAVINGATFVNTSKGTIFSKKASHGLINWENFTNQGTLQIEQATWRGIEHNSFSNTPFLNEATGKILIDGTADIGIANFQTPLINAGLISIKNTVGWGIAASSAVENKASGQVLIQNTQDAGLATWVAFQNYGSLTVENSGKENLGIFGGQFNNWAGGHVIARNSSWAGLINWGVTQNQGDMLIENPGHEGIRNLVWKFDNLAGGNLTISNVPSNWEAISTADGFFNSSFINLPNSPIAIKTFAGSGYLNNHACAEINMDGKILNLNALNNWGLLKTTFTGVNQNSGSIDNFGVIEDFNNSFNGVFIANSSVKVRPISGTIGGIIQNALEISGMPPYQFGSTWYKNANLTDAAGTYANGLNTFTPTIGMGTQTLYFTAKDLVNNCTKTVSIKVNIASPMIGFGGENDSKILLNNSPNPFSNNSMIKFCLPKDTEAKLVVYDSFGRLVEVIYEGEIIKDELYQFDFNAADKRIGIYMAALILKNGRTFTLQMVKADNR